MKLTRFFLAAFYAVMALLLAVSGLCLLIAPHLLLAPLHQTDQIMNAAIWPHQVGIGLLLAAALNLFCLFDTDIRPSLHWLLLFFTAGTAATHGLPQGLLWWLWLPSLIYLLPIIIKPVARLIRRASQQNVMEGEIKWFNPKKGYGFIIMPDNNEYFVHFKSIQNGNRYSLKNGTRVSFQLKMTDRGERADEVYIQ